MSAQTNSNDDSANDTPKTATNKLSEAKKDALCAKALDELSILDKLVLAREAEIKLLTEKIDLQKEKFQVTLELADARKNQAESLTDANKMLKEALAANERMIANKDKEIDILKKKRVSILTIIKAVGIGIGIGLALK